MMMMMSEWWCRCCWTDFTHYNYTSTTTTSTLHNNNNNNNNTTLMMMMSSHTTTHQRLQILATTTTTAALPWLDLHYCRAFTPVWALCALLFIANCDDIGAIYSLGDVIAIYSMLWWYGLQPSCWSLGSWLFLLFFVTFVYYCHWSVRAQLGIHNKYTLLGIHTLLGTTGHTQQQIGNAASDCFYFWAVLYYSETCVLNLKIIFMPKKVCLREFISKCVLKWHILCCFIKKLEFLFVFSNYWDDAMHWSIYVFNIEFVCWECSEWTVMLDVFGINDMSHLNLWYLSDSSPPDTDRH